MDCKASFEINPTGPNQPVLKGKVLDPKLGRFEGVDEFIKKASKGAIDTYNFYSMVHAPMTTCGCCECIAAMLPSCNGIMTVGRDYTGDTPSGMKFTTLAGVMGGGASSPGFVGHSKFNITQKKFILGDGGLLRMVWMPKMLKEECMTRSTPGARKWVSTILSIRLPTRLSASPKKRSCPSSRRKAIRL